MNRSFVFGVAASEYNFTGRTSETKRLIANFKEGINTILISPRRWGKTSLVKHVCRQLENDPSIITVYMDIFSCKSEYDFYNEFAASILKQTASKKDLWMENAKDFISRLSPTISYKPEPYTDFSLSLGITPKTHTPEEVLSLAEDIAKKKNQHIVVCIDEFQRIGEFSDTKYIQRRLRTVWQHQKLTSYCLFGSKRHLMSSMFQYRNMPFYQFGEMMYLQRIPTEEWIPYIVSHFEERNRHINQELAAKICESVDNFSSYVQQLSWIIFNQLEEGETAMENHLTNGIQELLDTNELLFMQQIEPLSEYQLNFLRAILAGHHTAFGEKKVREGFNLGSTSNIARIKTALIDRDLIDTDGKNIFINDPVFCLWLKRKIYY
mgnify:CR=1 FL=1